jgi:ferredoxin--NADP+ reductase
MIYVMFLFSVATIGIILKRNFAGIPYNPLYLLFLAIPLFFAFFMIKIGLKSFSLSKKEKYIKSMSKRFEGGNMRNLITGKRKLADRIYEMWVIHPEISNKAKAGQFLILRVDETGERIPLTICGKDRITGSVRIVFQVVGTSTHKLSMLNQGDYIKDIVGPLGNPSEIKLSGNVLIIGGGVGTATLPPLIEELKEAGNYVITVIGARNKDFVILRDELYDISDELIVTTDDGSYGRKGLVTDAMSDILSKNKIDAIWAIGPIPMMKYCSLTAKKFEKSIWVSLNPIMVDGTGMCGACRVEVGGETKFACIDGPEFDGTIVDWETLVARNKQYLDKEKLSYNNFIESVDKI